MKKVSIIIPTYNQRKYISKAIESALSQNYNNLEIIVSDDNSSVNIKNVIDKYYSFSNFKYFRNEKNLGRVGNYHKSLYEYATGDYVLVLDGDDYLIDNNYISEAMKLIEKEGVSVVFAKSKVFFEINKISFEDKINSDLPIVFDGNWFFLKFPSGYSISHSTTLYNRQKAIEIGYYNVDIISSDWESILRLIVNNKIGYINKFVSIWRKHNNNESKTCDINKILNNIIFIENSYNFALKNYNINKFILKNWKHRMIKRFFVKLIIKFTFLNQKNNLDICLKYFKQNYKFNYRLTVYNPILFIFLKLLKNKNIANFIFKDILKMGSFLNDLKN